MDDDLRAYLDAMRADLLGAINDGNERLLNRLNSLEHDFQNLRGFLLSDAASAGAGSI
jgi:hypothetical protein